MKLFVDKLQRYYDRHSTYHKQNLLFGCVENRECNPERFVIAYDCQHRIYDNICRGMIINFLGNYKLYTDSDYAVELLEITDDDIKYINDKINTLDGTLLCDIVCRFMRTHKVFE